MEFNHVSVTTVIGTYFSRSVYTILGLVVVTVIIIIQAQQ